MLENKLVYIWPGTISQALSNVTRGNGKGDIWREARICKQICADAMESLRHQIMKRCMGGVIESTNVCPSRYNTVAVHSTYIWTWRSEEPFWLHVSDMMSLKIFDKLCFEALSSGVALWFARIQIYSCIFPNLRCVCVRFISWSTAEYEFAFWMGKSDFSLFQVPNELLFEPLPSILLYAGCSLRHFCRILERNFTTSQTEAVH